MPVSPHLHHHRMYSIYISAGASFFIGYNCLSLFVIFGFQPRLPQLQAMFYTRQIPGEGFFISQNRSTAYRRTLSGIDNGNCGAHGNKWQTPMRVIVGYFRKSRRSSPRDMTRSSPSDENIPKQFSFEPTVSETVC